MQRQPEPSDGRPKIPDAGGRRSAAPQNQHKRGKTRFRDDRSRRHHHSASSSRHNVKKFDNTLNARDPYHGLRKDSPIKQSKKDKKPAKAESDPKMPELPMPIIAESVESGAFNIPIINGNDESLNQSQNLQNATQKDFKDLEMKMLDSIDTVGAAMNGGDNIPAFGENSNLSQVEADVEGLYATLREYLQVEGKFQPRLYLPVKPQRGEIAAGTRDGAVHVLRCLKVWYDLPTDVLFHAINLLDRFLTKMKVRLCHFPCISVSCMHIAILSHRPQLPQINTEDLVSISQCKCTAGDVRRMSVIIEEKLGAVGDTISPLHWLRLLLRLLRWAAVSLLGVSQQFFAHLLQESEMINRLEILLCDASCCNIRACELALVLLCTQLDSQLTMMQHSTANPHPELENLARISGFAMELQRICQIGDESFYSSHQAVVCVLERYNTRQKMPHRQCLVWRLSSRTLRVLRPTDKLTSTLPTIQEQQYLSNTNVPTGINSRMRSGSESSDDLNEDTKDWPTSPVVPILCTEN